MESDLFESTLEALVQRDLEEQYPFVDMFRCYQKLGEELMKSTLITKVQGSGDSKVENRLRSDRDKFKAKFFEEFDAHKESLQEIEKLKLEVEKTKEEQAVLEKKRQHGQDELNGLKEDFATLQKEKSFFQKEFDAVKHQNAEQMKTINKLKSEQAQMLDAIRMSNESLMKKTEDFFADIHRKDQEIIELRKQLKGAGQNRPPPPEEKEETSIFSAFGLSWNKKLDKKQEVARDKSEGGVDVKLFEGAGVADYFSVGGTSTVPVKEVGRGFPQPGVVMSTQFNHYGSLFAAGTNKSIQVWNLESKEATMKVTDINKSVLSLDFSRDSTRLLGAGNSNIARIWSVKSGKALTSFGGHPKKISRALFRSDQRAVITGCYDGIIRLFDMTHEEPKFKTNRVSGVAAVALYGNRILSGHVDKKIRLWNPNDRKPAVTFDFHDGIVTSVEFCPANPQQAVALSRDNTATIIDIRKKNAPLIRLSHKGFSVLKNWTNAAFSPDGEYISCGSRSGELVVWHVGTGKVEAVIQSRAQTPLTYCDWNPSGRGIIAAQESSVILFE